MTIEKRKRPDWLGIAGILWGVLGILCAFPAGIVVLFFDSPSPDWNANYFFLFSVISFPIVCIGAGIAILFLKKKYGKLAFIVSPLPVLVLISIFIGGAWMSLSSCGKLDCRVPTMQEQGDAAHVGKCTLPAMDGGDGLETTGCGVLEAGASAMGTLNSTSEAHNWQFSAQNGDRITVTIEHHGNTCSQIRILDSAGSVIEGFEDENRSNICSSGMSDDMTTTSYYYFTPPGKGTYILRITAPQAPSDYWLKIG